MVKVSHLDHKPRDISLCDALGMSRPRIIPIERVLFCLHTYRLRRIDALEFIGLIRGITHFAYACSFTSQNAWPSCLYSPRIAVRQDHARRTFPLRILGV